MAIDVNKIVQFYQGTKLPDDAVNHPNRVYFIKNGNIGELYKGNVLIAQTNNGAEIEAIEQSISNLSGSFDEYVTGHTALYEALVKAVGGNTTAIQTLSNEIRNGTSINDFATVENALAGKEAAGAAASAQAAAKDYTDAEVKKANDAAAAADAKAVAADGKAATAQQAADKAQEEVDDLEAYVGTLPTTATATDIVGYIQEKTSGIATEGAMAELEGRVEDAEEKIEAVEGKLVDIETTVVAEIAAEIATEKGRAEQAEAGLSGRIKAVEDDYLKAADKTELTNAIATAKQEAIDRILDGALEEDFDTLKEVSDWILSDTTGAAALQKDVADIKADYLKAADKTELEGKITAAQEAADQAQDEVDTLEGVVETLSGVVDTKAAAADLTALTTRVTTAEGEIDTLQAEMDAVEAKAAANESAIATANTEIAKKASQTDLDALKGRVDTAETDIDNLQAELDTATTGVKARLTAVENKATDNATNITDLLAALEWHQA